MLTRKMYFCDDSRFDEKNELILEVYDLDKLLKDSLHSFLNNDSFMKTVR